MSEQESDNRINLILSLANHALSQEKYEEVYQALYEAYQNHNLQIQIS